MPPRQLIAMAQYSWRVVQLSMAEPPGRLVLRHVQRHGNAADIGLGDTAVHDQRMVIIHEYMAR